MCRAYDTGLPADPGLFLGVFCLVFILCVVTVGGTEAFAEQPEIRAAVNCPRHPERCLEAGGKQRKGDKGTCLCWFLGTARPVQFYNRWQVGDTTLGVVGTPK